MRERDERGDADPRGAKPPDDESAADEAVETVESRGLALGVAVGGALGLSLGLAIDNLALGLGIGIGVGVAIGGGVEHSDAT